MSGCRRLARVLWLLTPRPMTPEQVRDLVERTRFAQARAAAARPECLRRDRDDRGRFIGGWS